MKELCLEIVEILKEKGLTLSCAESCTGGLIAKSITDIAGCSSVFFGGVVSYDNSVKENVLMVPHGILKSYGAVSAPVAEKMAEGVRSLMKTNIGISTTGIAGPGGGTKEKPVGTVYLGYSINGETETELLVLDSSLDREEIRQKAVYYILSRLKEKIA